MHQRSRTLNKITRTGDARTKITHKLNSTPRLDVNFTMDKFSILHQCKKIKHTEQNHATDKAQTLKLYAKLQDVEVFFTLHQNTNENYEYR